MITNHQKLIIKDSTILEKYDYDKIYNREIKYKILDNLRNYHEHKFNYFTDDFGGCNIFKLYINKIDHIDNDKLYDLFIIDNLHDFTLERMDIADIELLNYIRQKISKYIKNQININLILDAHKCPKDVNDLKNKIFDNYNMSNILSATSELPLSHVGNNSVYFETAGIININDAICPYKLSIDEAPCNKDTLYIRDNLQKKNNEKFDDIMIELLNYDNNIVNLFIKNNMINMIINEQAEKYYTHFLEKSSNIFIKINKQKIKKLLDMYKLNSDSNKLLSLSDDEINNLTFLKKVIKKKISIRFSRKHVRRIIKMIEKMKIKNITKYELVIKFSEFNIHQDNDNIILDIFSENDIYTDYNVTNNEIIINNRKMILINSVSNIFYKLKCKYILKKNNKISETEFDKYMMAGLHLKRIGDYGQVHIFNKSNIDYFQTIDEFCFLYACSVVDTYKFLILNKKVIFVKIDYNNETYSLVLKINDSLKLKHITEIKNELANIIKKNFRQDAGGNIEKSHIKNDNILLNQLVKIVKNIDSNDMYYIIYKTNREQIKLLLNENDFITIDNIIEHLKVFSEELNHVKSDDVLKLLNATNYIINLLCEDDDYTNTICKICNELKNNEMFIKMFNVYPYIYYDLIFNYDNYNINPYDDIIDIHNNMYNIYHKRYHKEITEMTDDMINADYIQILYDDPNYNNNEEIIHNYDWDLIELDYMEYIKLKQYNNQVRIKAKKIANELIKKRRETKNIIKTEEIKNKYTTNLTNLIDDCKKHVIYKLVKITK